MFVLTFMCNSCTPHGDFGEPTHRHAQTYTSGGILTQWRGPSAPLCFCWRWWSPTVSVWQRPQQKPNQLQNDGGAEQGITWISHSLTPSHSYALSLSVWLSKTFRPGSYFFGVSDTGRRSRARLRLISGLSFMHPVTDQVFLGPWLALWVDESYRVVLNKHVFWPVEMWFEAITSRLTSTWH